MSELHQNIKMKCHFDVFYTSTAKLGKKEVDELGSCRSLVGEQKGSNIQVFREVQPTF
jgi:hypothetical protein